MEELQQKLATLEAKKASLFEQGSVDQVEVSRLNAEIKETQAQINALQQQAEVTAKHEERVEQAQEKVAYLFDNITVYGNELRNYFIDEETYQMVRIEVQKNVNALIEQQSAEFSAIETSYKAQQQADAERFNNLQEQYDKLFEEAAAYRKQAELNEEEARRTIGQLELERNDALSKRDAAVVEKEGLELLVKEKDEHIQTLRTEMATSARGAARTLTPEEIKRESEEKRQAWINSRIKVTNIRWSDEIKKTHYNAELASTGETITFGRLELGKYLEVSSEEAARFRDELATEQQPVGEDRNPVQDDIPAQTDVTEDTIPVPAFQDEETPTGNVVEHETVRQDDAEGPVSREEFEALKRRVDRLEGTRKEDFSLSA